MFGDRYQYALIGLGVLATALLAIFFMRELFPEYKIYQEDYVALEKFRASYTGQPSPAFSYGVKQIVKEREDRGPAKVERCISCHVALQIPDYSPTKIAHDINGQIIYDKNGLPTQVENDSYVWKHLDEKIVELTKQGKLSEAQKLRDLKTAQVGDFVYDVTKVLRAHPLMGRETRSFEYHSMEEYGCISCHSGNGLGLVTDRAHGPVFDGTYEVAYKGYKPEFLERDKVHDPEFSRVFNDEPGARLLFQTSPIYVGALIQAKCINCHLTSSEKLQNSESDEAAVLEARKTQLGWIQKSYEYELEASKTLAALQESFIREGYSKTLANLEKKARDLTLSTAQLEPLENQISFLKSHPKDTLELIKKKIAQSHASLEEKKNQLDFERSLLKHVAEVDVHSILNPLTTGALQTEVDSLTKEYQKGEELYISQACYACHRIAGLSRGGVGPELTHEGNNPPWFIKESIVWPQADLKTSTMPNYRLDHEELEALVTFLLGQKGERKALMGTEYKNKISKWDLGKKQPFEKPIPAEKIKDINYGMTVFATEGCASCHRLHGFTSNVGYRIEKDAPAFGALLKEREWFQKFFPEDSLGSEIVKNILAHGPEIDTKIALDVRKHSLLEQIEVDHPGLIAAYYAPFKYAARANTDEKYQERLHKVLMTYVQEYGLGRLIGPRPNWSGVFRTDEWLMEHFRNPSSHSPHSIMPVMPFDDSKFYALTYMLDVVGGKNRDQLKSLWEDRGFRPEEAFSLHCSQCHGTYREGNGPVSEWIYPLPKNLNKADFLRNLTKDRVMDSIHHGVKGTPMPPWGEVAGDKLVENTTPILTMSEIEQLADWLFSQVPGGQIIRSEEDVAKWQYGPEDVVKDLKREQGIDENVEKLFTIHPNPPGSPDPYSYYIKKEYYTPEAIAKGEAFFVVNCATCHGKEADGAGLRAEVLHDAKPRMLTNLDWINSRDDLRLLRSIKYGVPGTAMTPWGDLTSSKQRLELVVFIRSLSESEKERADFLSIVYESYDALDQALESARFEEHKKMDDLLRHKEKAEQSLREKPSVEAFKELEAAKLALSKQEAINQRWADLKELLKGEKEVYQGIGHQALTLSHPEELLNPLQEIIKINHNKIILNSGKPIWRMTPDEEAKIARLGKEFAANIDARLAKLKGEDKKSETKAKMLTLDKLKHKLLSGLEEAKEKREKEKKLIEEINNS